jgi:hypothetical protein
MNQQKKGGVMKGKSSVAVVAILAMLCMAGPSLVGAESVQEKRSVTRKGRSRA